MVFVEQLYSPLGKCGIYLERFYDNFYHTLLNPAIPTTNFAQMHSPNLPLVIEHSMPYIRDCSSDDSDYWSMAVTPGCPFQNENETLRDIKNGLIFAYPPPSFKPSVNPSLKTHHSNANELFSAQEMRELKPLLSKPKVHVPSHYMCHICNKPGHDIKDCSLFDSQPGLTPYQGSKVVYGSFLCSKCKRVWGSASSRANKRQPCTKCKVWEFPYKQMSLKEAQSQGLVHRLANGYYKVIDRRHSHNLE